MQIPTRPFRFGVQISTPRKHVAWAEQARRAEALGYDVFLMPDHFLDQFANGPALAIVSEATALRIGTFVLQNDLRHPALIAQEAATLDVLSGGRFESRARGRRLVVAGLRANRYPLRLCRNPSCSSGGEFHRHQGTLRRGSVYLCRPALLDYSARRSAQARPAAASAHPHRRRRTAHALHSPLARPTSSASCRQCSLLVASSARISSPTPPSPSRSNSRARQPKPASPTWN